MTLISNGELIDDAWANLDDEDAIPAEGSVIISLTRWRQDEATLKGRNAPLGIRLSSGENPSEIENDLGRFEIIALDFPAYTDGRAYSYARRLRDKYGYEGELRATGNVLRDQLLFMHRCGFDSYDVEKPDAVEQWLKATAEQKIFYQPAGTASTFAAESVMSKRKS